MERKFGAHHIVFESISSTNTYIKDNCQDMEDMTSVVALEQTNGRGRLGNSWASGHGSLYLSVLLKNPPYVDTLTLRCAVAVARAIERLYPIDVNIKWTNDIIVNNFKVCGILCESRAIGEEINVICGVGLNVMESSDYFKDNNLKYGSSLYAICGKTCNMDEIINGIFRQLEAVINCPFLDIKDEYEERCITLGKDIRIIKNGIETVAFAKEIALNGNLVCENEGGVFMVNAGEVSVRGMFGYV